MQLLYYIAKRVNGFCLFCLIEVQESTVVFVGDIVVVGGDENVIIDCGLLIDHVKPFGNFCVIWRKNDIPITTNSSCTKISVDMRKVMISSDYLCKPGRLRTTDSYGIFITDDAYTCTVLSTNLLHNEEQNMNQANAGNEFYLGFFQNYNSAYCGAEKYPPIIWVTTPETTSVSFVITTHNGIIYSGTVCPTLVTYISIPLDLIVSESAPMAISERFKGIRIKAEGDKKIIVFGQYEELGSNDAYVALPVVPLPIVMNLEYILVSVYGDTGTGVTVKDSVGLIIGNEDDTHVTIVPSVTIEHKLAHLGSFSPEFSEYLNTITIHKYQTLYLQVRGGDISGTRVITNKPVSVFSGHECANVPLQSFGCDMLIEQIPPTYTWGTEVVTLPLITRKDYVIKIIASQQSTVVDVTYTGDAIGSAKSISTFTLNSGQFRELVVRDYALIKSNWPIAVFQISRSFLADNNIRSDPFMLMVPSRQQYLNGYTIVSAPFRDDLEGRIPNLVAYTHYINIVVPAEFFNANQIVGNRGSPIAPASSYSPIRYSNNKVWGYGALLRLYSGAQIIKHLNRNAVLSVVVYGFTTQMSYGYCGGLHYPTISNGEIICN